MSFEDIMHMVRGGDQLIVSEIQQVAGVSSTVRIACLTKDDIRGISSRARTSMVVSMLSYMRLARQIVDDPDQAMENGLLMDGGVVDVNRDQMDEIISSMRQSMKFLHSIWPKEVRYAKALVRSDEIARFCFKADPMLGGQINTPVLLPQGWGGNAIRVALAPTIRGREVPFINLNGSVYADFTSCPVPEGAHVISGT
jgi:hypothetical protein